MMLALLGVVAAAFIPMIISGFGAPIFWSQALGITSGWLLMLAGLTPRQRRTAKWSFGVAIAMATATLIAFALQRAAGLV